MKMVRRREERIWKEEEKKECILFLFFNFFSEQRVEMRNTDMAGDRGRRIKNK